MTQVNCNPLTLTTFTNPAPTTFKQVAHNNSEPMDTVAIQFGKRNRIRRPFWTVPALALLLAACGSSGQPSSKACKLTDGQTSAEQVDCLEDQIRTVDLKDVDSWNVLKKAQNFDDAGIIRIILDYIDNPRLRQDLYGTPAAWMSNNLIPYIKDPVLKDMAQGLVTVNPANGGALGSPALFVTPTGDRLDYLALRRELLNKALELQGLSTDVTVPDAATTTAALG